MPPTRWGEAIQRLLVARSWTQKQLAEAAAVRPNTLTNIIKHRQHTDTATLSRIAGAFGVDVGELFATKEDAELLSAYRESRIQRVAEAVMSQLSSRVSELVRQDFEKLQMSGTPVAAARKPRRRARH